MGQDRRREKDLEPSFVGNYAKHALLLGAKIAPVGLAPLAAPSGEKAEIKHPRATHFSTKNEKRITKNESQLNLHGSNLEANQNRNHHANHYNFQPKIGKKLAKKIATARAADQKDHSTVCNRTQSYVLDGKKTVQYTFLQTYS